MIELIDGHFYEVTRDGAGRITRQAGRDPVEAGTYALVNGAIVKTDTAPVVVLPDPQGE